MEIKQHNSKYMSQRGNFKRNLKKFWAKLKCNLKFVRCSKPVLSRKFTALNAYIRKGRSIINNQNFHFRKLGKEQIKSKVNKIKEIKLKETEK